MLNVSCSIAWIACDHSLKLGTLAHQEIESLDAVRMPGGGHQRPRFLDRGRRIGLVADALEQFVGRRGKFRKRVNEAADPHRRHILDDVDQRMAVEGEMHGAATRGSANGFRLVLTQTPWMTLWLKRATDMPGVALAVRQVTGSVIRT